LQCRPAIATTQPLYGRAIAHTKKQKREYNK
jgi:hypothetical protein